MHLSKKAKITLLTTIPAVAIATSISIATPIVLINECDVLNVLNDESTNIVPILSANHVNENIQYLPFNPTQFSKKFFVDKIANQPSMKDPNISTNNYLFSWDKNLPNGVKYNINRVGYYNQRVEANITKTYKGRSIEYTTPIKVDNNFFISNSSSLELEKIEKTNFLKSNSWKFKSFFKNGITKISVINATSLDLNQIKSEQLKLISPKDDLLIYPGYTIESKMFEFNQEKIKFEFEVTKDLTGKSTIWTANEAYPVDANGKFDQTKSLAFQYLRKIFPKDVKDQEIQNIIFNSKYDPSDPGQNPSKPLFGYYAILVKLTIGTESFYTIVWQDILQSVGDNIFELAPEINYRVKQGLYPTAVEIEKNPNKYLEMTALPSAGLQYNIKKVTIPSENNEDKTIVNLTIEIQSLVSSELEPRIYNVVINSGIKGEKQSNFDNEIQKLLGNTNNGELTPLIPTVVLTGMVGTTLGEKVSELYGLLSNPNEFNKKVIVNNVHSSIISYVPIFVDSISDKILIYYEIVSATDPSIKSTVVPTIAVEIANTTNTTP